MSKDFNIEKLKGGDNYHTWSFAIKNVLTFKGLGNCITTPVAEKDETKLSSCKAILSLSVDSSIYVHIQNCVTAVEIWNTLRGLYENKGLTRKIGLLRNLISTRLDGCSGMQDYVDRIMCFTNKLNEIGFTISNEWTGAILLAGLTDDFKPFIMGIEASEGDIKSDRIETKLLDPRKIPLERLFLVTKKSTIEGMETANARIAVQKITCEMHAIN